MVKIQRKFTLDTAIATLDFAKGRHFGYVRTLGGAELKSFGVSNDRAGLDLFRFRVEEFCKAQGVNRLIIGGEPTGSYSLPMFSELNKYYPEIVQINPKHGKRVRELCDNSPLKNDQKDTGVIADIIALGYGKAVIFSCGHYAEIRGLVHHRESVNQKIVRVTNQLEAVLARVFPEFLRVMKQLRLKSSLYLLKNYPLAEDLLRLTKQSLSTKLRKVSRGRLGKQRAEELLAVSRNTIGVREGLEASKLLIGDSLAQLELFEQQLGQVETRIRKVLKEIPYAEKIQSIKGLGIITAACLVGEIGNIDQFSSAKQLTKLAGLNLFEVSSGKLKGRKRISKRGRSLMRKSLYFAALNVVRKGGVFYQKYQSHLKKGMAKNKALVAIARKLLRVIFALAKNNTDFKKSYDCNSNPERALS